MIANRDPERWRRTLWLTGYDCSTLGPIWRSRARLVADPHPDQGFFSRSDNINSRARASSRKRCQFRRRGEHDMPTSTDEVSTVDFAHVTDSIRSMLAPVLWLANSSASRRGCRKDRARAQLRARGTRRQDELGAGPGITPFPRF